MKKYLLFAVFLALLAGFTGCRTNRINTSIKPVYVTNTKPMYLLSPENTDGEVDSYQLLQGQFGSQSFTLLCYIISNSDGINITLLNDFGTDMGSLNYDGNQVNFESVVFPENLPAEYILLDIQNAYYKKESLEKAYKLAGLTFEEENTAEASVRVIKSGKKIVEVITKNGNYIKIQNSLRGYEYNLIEGEE